MFPTVAGAGVRLFDQISGTKPLRLLDTHKVGDGLVFYAYEFLHLLTPEPVSQLSQA